MTFRRALDGLAARCAGLYALLRALPGMARVIVGWTEVPQAVVVSGDDVVDDVGAGESTEVADVAVGGEDEWPDLRAPPRRQPIDPPTTAPSTRRHEDPDRDRNS